MEMNFELTLKATTALTTKGLTPPVTTDKQLRHKDKGMGEKNRTKERLNMLVHAYRR